MEVSIVVKWVKLLPVITAIPFEHQLHPQVLATPLSIQLPADTPRKPVEVDFGTWSLAVCEIQMEFQAGFCLAQPLPLWLFAE